MFSASVVFPIAGLVALLQQLERILHCLTQRNEVRATAAALFGNAEYLHFSGRKHFLAIAPFRLEAVIDDFSAGIDQLPHHRFFAHDLGVGADVCRRRRGAGKFNQVAGAADLLGKIVGLEPLTQGNGIEGLALFRQLADAAIDQPMVAPIEILLGEKVAYAIQ
jgi:hypothetical protein